MTGRATERTGPTVLIGHRMAEHDLAALSSAAPGANVTRADGRDGVLAAIVGADAYLPGPWDAEVLRAAGRLRWVHFSSAGLDGLLFRAAVESDVTITNSAGVYAVPMAEHAMALMLAFCRALNVCLRRGPEQLWHARGARRSLTGRMTELGGATLGILGYGGIGRETARLAKAFGMRVLALRRHPAPDELADEVSGLDGLDELLRRSDYLLVSCALTEETRGLIGARELALMKPTAVVVNVARGAVVDEDALIEALRKGTIGGAGLDVTTREPLPTDSPLWGMENVIITPHVSAASPRTSGRSLELVAENLRRFAAGEPVLNVVDKRAGY